MTLILCSKFILFNFRKLELNVSDYMTGAEDNFKHKNELYSFSKSLSSSKLTLSNKLAVDQLFVTTKPMLAV